MSRNIRQIGDDAVELHIKAKPRAKKNELIVKEDEIIIRVTASPVDHQANEAIIVFLAGYFRIAKSSIILIKGQTNAHKTFRINGLTFEAIKEKIGLV